MKKFIKPSIKAVEQMLNLSEKYNTPKDHYDIVIQQGTMGSADVSYAIDYIQRKNEYGRHALPINNKYTRAKNIEISENPMKFQKEMTSKPGKTLYVGGLREQFKEALKVKDYGRATILYITLVHDNKDKIFKDSVDEKKEDLKEFFAYMEKVPGIPEGMKHEQTKD